jgi:hypothetical protein
MLPAVMTRGLVPRPMPIAGLCVVLALFGAGCARSASSASPTTIAARPATQAHLVIVSPAPNAATGRTVELVVRLDHARLAPPTQVGGALRSDRGHIHVSVDGVLVSMPLRLSDPLPRLTPGSHTVQAEFVASDHLPFANRVVAAVTFRVR